MTIRQSVALFYGIAALCVAAIQGVPSVAGAIAPAAMPAGLAEFGAGRSGHAEIDDLPAYLTDGTDDAVR